MTPTTTTTSLVTPTITPLPLLSGTPSPQPTAPNGNQGITEFYIYPNPLQLYRSANIIYMLPRDDTVQLRIYTYLGDAIRTWRFTPGEPGGQGGRRNTVLWDGRDSRGQAVASGGYLVEVRTSSEALIKKIAVHR